MKSFTKIAITVAMTAGLSTSALAGDPKAGTTAAAPAKTEAAKKMEMPKAPQELIDAGKLMVGTWKCTGKGVMDPSNPTVMTDMKSTATFKQDLDKWWVVGTVTTGPMKMTMYRTYDPVAKKWIQVGLDNMGGSDNMWSMGPKDGKVTWEGDCRMMGTSMKSRVTEQATAKQMTLVGEMSMDGGKTWMKSMEMTCKK
ncbi:MAG: DUF1579 family protein [Kofleriaceae bacterium]